jgi:hypothetical protein
MPQVSLRTTSLALSLGTHPNSKVAHANIALLCLTFRNSNRTANTIEQLISSLVDCSKACILDLLLLSNRFL